MSTALFCAKEYGLSVKDVGFDLAAVVKRSRGVATQLSSGVKHLLKKNKVEVYDGFGKLAGKGKVAVDTEGKNVATLAARHVILATGARARTLPGLEPDGKVVWTYKNALVPDKMPKSLLVVGSGAIGIEFASFFKTMGADVTVVEVVDCIVPAEDEISSLLKNPLKNKDENYDGGCGQGLKRLLKTPW